MPSDSPRSIYGLDKHGSHWYWNCGWRCLENEDVCFPHYLFRKSIRPNIVSWTEVLKPKPKNTSSDFHPRCRPYGDWRRADDKVYDHPIYGEVQLKETDGVHAIVRNKVINGDDVQDIPVEVQLSNLTVVKPRRSSSSRQSRQSRPSKWGDLKEHIPEARKRLKEMGYEKPSDDELRKCADLIKTTLTNLFS